ncbi:hypothetical protein Gotur_006502 [Gossypium turneri]
MSDLSRNLIHLRWLVKLIDFRAVGKLSWGLPCWQHCTERCAGYVGIPTALEDIRLLLDQRSKAHFQWTPYDDPAIRAIISDEFFQNLNIWHVNVPLINYATVEMHQTDRVLRQFGFRQQIPVTLEYDHIPTRELIIVPELACTPDYMSWFRIQDKPYLLSKSRGIGKFVSKRNDRAL